MSGLPLTSVRELIELITSLLFCSIPAHDECVWGSLWRTIGKFTVTDVLRIHLRNTDVVRHCSLMCFHDGEKSIKSYHLEMYIIHKSWRRGRKFLINATLWRSVSIQFLHYFKRKYTQTLYHWYYFKIALQIKISSWNV